MSKKIIEILNDIITLIALIGLICAVGIITNGIISFVLFIITLVCFSIKLMITAKKIKEIDSNTYEESVENFEHNLLTYSNDIAKIKSSIKIEPNELIFDEEQIDESSVESNKEASVNNIESEHTINTKTEININDNFSLTNEELQKCIRKLGKGRKASDKAKELAKKYGYELKDGETFIAPRKK